MPNISVESKSVSCKTDSSKTILQALAESGIVLSAPCGGRGICGKCRLTLLEGSVRLNTAEGETAVRPGRTFPACRAYAESDIRVELPEETLVESELGKLENGRHTERSAAPAPGQHSGAAKSAERIGVGVDIGTTTVSAECIDLDTGESLGSVSAFNDQRVFGADVMSRINAAMNGKLGELTRLITRQISGMLEDFKTRYSVSKIEKAAVSGNTTMLHLFLGEDPSGMGKLPFTPAFLESRFPCGEECNLPADKVITMPGISAFVGGDIVSGLAFLDILKGEDNVLLVDIGTNGEMALFRGGDLLCTSTAAGPCFEGAEITCGMGALPGAINAVIPAKGGEKYAVSCTAIAGAPPRGICGCGLIDAIAALKTMGIIDETGAMDSPWDEEGFPLAGEVRIYNKDVRMFQLAKSAILSGIKILCKKAGLTTEDISTVYIAGGFGFFINKDNAVSAGLLPASFPAKTAICGNLSLKGALRMLTDESFAKRCNEIAAAGRNIDLASDPDFMNEFSDNMMF